MSEAEGTLTQLTFSSSGLAGELVCPQRIQPRPGQYLLARALDLPDPLPTVLFPASLPGTALSVAAPLPKHWMAGQHLHLRGPLGHGFTLSANSRRVALASLDTNAERLLPLMLLALKQGANVAFYSITPPSTLPPEVEILPLDELREASGWADYLALDIPASRLVELPDLVGLTHGKQFPCTAEALVLTDIPCTGLAQCGLCSVLTKKGWKLACQDGPVFDLNLLGEK